MRRKQGPREKLIALDFAFRNVGIARLSVTTKRANNALLLDDMERYYDAFTVESVYLIHPEASDESYKGGLADQFVSECEYLAKQLSSFCEVCQHHYLFCELPVGSQSSPASKLQGAASGIYGSLNYGYFRNEKSLVTPKQVKKITGNGQASKKQMIEFCMKRWPNLSWKSILSDEHMADAICVGLAGYKKVWEESKDE